MTLLQCLPLSRHGTVCSTAGAARGKLEAKAPRGEGGGGGSVGLRGSHPKRSSRGRGRDSMPKLRHDADSRELRCTGMATFCDEALEGTALGVSGMMLAR